MYSSIRWLIVAAAVMLAVGPIGAQRIKVTTQTVPLYVTVTDSEKRLVPDLTRDDFEVYDNAKLQTLTNFDNEPTPITVVVMLDTSGSMTLALDLVKDGAEQFLMRMMPLDMGMVGAFNDKIEFHPVVVHRQPRPARARPEGSRLRVPDAAVRRGRSEHRSAQWQRRTQGRAGLHGWRRQLEQEEFWLRDGTRACGRSDDLLDRSRERILQRPAARAQLTGSRPAQAVRGNGRRILPAEEERRPRADLYTDRAGAPQPVQFSGSRRKRWMARSTNSRCV